MTNVNPQTGVNKQGKIFAKTQAIQQVWLTLQMDVLSTKFTWYERMI